MTSFASHLDLNPNQNLKYQWIRKWLAKKFIQNSKLTSNDLFFHVINNIALCVSAS